MLCPNWIKAYEVIAVCNCLRNAEANIYFKAVKFSGTFNGSSDSSSESGSSEELGSKPSRLSSSFTKFDILERERMENERRRIREKRKSLLEEETKLFEEAKRQQEEQDENENEYSSETPQVPIFYLVMCLI